jgi:NitT/TauT family transport system ATP-binding protein
MNAKLEVRHISKSFGHLRVLSDIDFQVDDHEFVAIVGPSGCGKTTLLRTIAGIEKPDAGDILIDGRALARPGPDRGFVFQQDSLFPWRTIWQNAVFGLEVNGILREDTRQRTRDLLKLVGLAGINPEVLVMDEPFSALDAQTREVMQVELLRIWQQGRKTVLFITHQIDEAVFLADRIVVLGRRPGRVKEIIPIELPRPRALAIKRKAEFGAYVERVWNLIEKDVHDSVQEQAELAAAAAE